MTLELEVLVKGYPLAFTRITLPPMGSQTVTATFRLKGNLERLVAADPQDLLIQFPDWPCQVPARATELALGLVENRVWAGTLLTFTVQSLSRLTRCVELVFLGTTTQSEILRLKALAQPTIQPTPSPFTRQWRSVPQPSTALRR